MRVFGKGPTERDTKSTHYPLTSALFPSPSCHRSMDRSVEEVMEDGRVIYFGPSGHPDNFIGAGVFMVKNDPASYAFLEEWFNYARAAELFNDSDNGILHYMLSARLPDYDHSCDQQARDLKHSIKPCLEPFLGRPNLDFGDLLVTPRLVIPAGSTVADTTEMMEAADALCAHGHSVGTFFSSSRELYNCSAYAL